MSKQEKIRFQAYRLFCQHCQALQKTMGWKGKPCWVIQYNEPEAICAAAVDAVKGLLDYLHSQGALIKVDRELPKLRYPDNRGVLELLRAGYVAVETLIEVNE